VNLLPAWGTTGLRFEEQRIAGHPIGSRKEKQIRKASQKSKGKRQKAKVKSVSRRRIYTPVIVPPAMKFRVRQLHPLLKHF
jgi:hypothetical protein